MPGNRIDMIERAAARLRRDVLGSARPALFPGIAVAEAPPSAPRANAPVPVAAAPDDIPLALVAPPTAVPVAMPAPPVFAAPIITAPIITPTPLNGSGHDDAPPTGGPVAVPVADSVRTELASRNGVMVEAVSDLAVTNGHDEAAESLLVDVAEPRHSRTVVLDTARLALAGTVDWTADRTPVMEELRLIKRRLLRRAFDNPETGNRLSHLVMVTSAKPREGKTFAATNIAISISLEEDYNVLLVDADIRRQALRQNLGLEANQGFVDLLLNPGLDMADVLLRTNIPRLSVLPAGTMSDRAPELLASSRMRDLIDDMAARYRDRIIIFDTAPCLVSSDAATLAAHVGQVVFVVEAEQTQQHEIVAGLNLISACPEISLILNKAQPLATTSYGGYGAY
jgi:receptor protein-tyrosine kinase